MLGAPYFTFLECSGDSVSLASFAGSYDFTDLCLGVSWY